MKRYEKQTYIKKAIGDPVKDFKARINHYNSESKFGVSAFGYRRKVFFGVVKSHCLQGSFFCIRHNIRTKIVIDKTH